MSEAKLDSAVEYKVIDDTVCKKYSSQTEMVCYDHSSTMGTVLSHDYVTSLYVNNGVAVSDGLKLYGNERKCKEKSVEFKTRVQLACELIKDHVSRAKRQFACGILGSCAKRQLQSVGLTGAIGLAR